MDGQMDRRYVRVFEIIHHLKRIEAKYLFEQFTPDADYNSTVGGPTNIASITKADDIKWIKK
jgi:hypothetical protein